MDNTSGRRLGTAAKSDVSARCCCSVMDGGKEAVRTDGDGVDPLLHIETHWSCSVMDGERSRPANASRVRSILVRFL